MPAPITRDCDLLVEQVVMATDDFSYVHLRSPSGPSSALEISKLKHIPVKLH